MEDYFVPGDWDAVCFECGSKKKASMLRKHWQGYYVCPEHWEERHPQDFVRTPSNTQQIPWAQPVSDQFTYMCNLLDRTCYPSVALSGCMVAGNTPANISDLISSEYTNENWNGSQYVCAIINRTCYPSAGVSGCMIAGNAPANIESLIEESITNE